MSDTDESSGFSSLLANMRAAMEKPDPPLILPLPESVLGKRNRGDYEQDDDESTSASPEGSTPGDSNEEGSTSSAIQPVPNKNIANLARQVGTAMYLRADQVEALVSFALNDTPLMRSVKTYAMMMHVDNELKKVVQLKPKYEVSPELEKNIKSYACGVLLSTKLISYKGDAPLQALLDIVKKLCPQLLPPGHENVPVDWGKVKRCGGEALTQCRASFKKAIKQGSSGSPPDCPNVFTLSQSLVAASGSQDCKATIPLCARVALLRAVYVQDSSEKYWDSVDRYLKALRNEANGNSVQIKKVFDALLEADRTTYGTAFVLDDDTADPWQLTVDQIVEGTPNEAVGNLRPM